MAQKYSWKVHGISENCQIPKILGYESKGQKFTVKKKSEIWVELLGLSTFPEVVEDAFPFDTGNFPICVPIESSRNYPLSTLSLGRIITG